MLKFVGGSAADKPEIERIEFKFDNTCQLSYCQCGDEQWPLDWTNTATALSVCVLGCVLKAFEGTGEPYFLVGPRTGSLAATLGDAIYQNDHPMRDLFSRISLQETRADTSRSSSSVVVSVFRGLNKSGKNKEKGRRIAISSQFLPPDCIKIFWDPRKSGRWQELRTQAEVCNLMEKLHDSLRPSTQKDPLECGLPGPPRISSMSSTCHSEWDRYLSQDPECQAAIGQYLSRYSGRYGHVRVLGMSRPLPLREVYTALQMIDPVCLKKWKTANDLENAFRQSNKRTFLPSEAEPVDGLLLANRVQFLNVLGQPGAGKSTFLRRMGLEALLSPADGQYQHGCLPVFLELKRFREKGSRLSELIRRELTSFGFPRASADVALKNGKLLVLLDGLDEVPEDNIRDVIEDIRQFVGENDTNRFITSCRTAFYKTWFSRFTDFVLAEFDDEQIQAFLHNWFSSSLDRERGTAGKLWRMLAQYENAATLELARTPLLLTFICLFHDEKLSLPTNRSELYEEALRILMERWAAEKRIRDGPIAPGLTSRWELLLLEQIAGPAFTRDEVFFHEKTLIGHIDRVLAKDLNAPHLAGEDVLVAIEVDQGVFVKRARNIYSFSHLTIQEYLAARYYLGTGEINSIIAEHFFEQRWREVFLLLTGIGRADAILLEMFKVVSTRINAHKGLRSLLLWMSEARIFLSMAPGATQRTAVLFVLRVLDAKLDTEEERDNWDRVLDLAMAFDLGLRANHMFMELRTFAQGFKESMTFTAAANLVEHLQKALLLNDRVASSLEHNVELLKSRCSERKYDTPCLTPKELKLALLDAFGIPASMRNWTKRERTGFEELMFGCNLLVQCKESALSVSADVWSHIVNNLLVPTAT